jgi:hypothetical protein
MTEANAPDSLTILENSHAGGCPPCSGRLTAPLLCMNNCLFMIYISFLARAFEKYSQFFNVKQNFNK